MKKKSIILTLLPVTLLSANLVKAQAIWTGAESSNWFDAGNWSWEDGESRIPDENTDVYLTDWIWIPSATIPAKARSIIGMGGAIEFASFSTLEVYGNIVDSLETVEIVGVDNTGASILNAIISFKGSEDQFISGADIRIGDFKIEKLSGNVIVVENPEPICIEESLLFRNSPVPLGNAPAGNLILKNAAVNFWEHISIVLPNHRQNQIPPHIITTDSNAKVNHAIRHWMAGSRLFPVGNLRFPVGYSEYSYTPVTVFSTDSNQASWSVNVRAGIPSDCGGAILSADSAVNITWNVLPYLVESIIDDPLGEIWPVDILFNFNKANYNYDVRPDYLPHNPLHLYTANDSIGCISEDISVDLDSNYIKVKSHNRSQFGTFVISNETNITDITSHKTETNVLEIYPNPVQEQINIRILEAHPAVSLRITDITGKVLMTRIFKPNSLNQFYPISLGDIPKGMYIIQVKGEGYYKVRKIIKS